MFRVSLPAIDFVREKEIAHLQGLEFGKVRGQPGTRDVYDLRTLVRKKERVGSLNRLSKYKFVGDAERDLDREKYRKVFRKRPPTRIVQQINNLILYPETHNRNQPRENYTSCMLERSTD